MSKIQDVPFITKVIDTLSDELKSGLYDLIDGKEKTPVFRSLVNNDYAITEANDKGKVQFVTLETLRGNYTGYLAYNSVYCVLIAFKGNTQALDMLNINVAKHTFAFVNESLSILELRVELEDCKEGVTPTDLGVTNNNIHLAKGTTQIGEGVNFKTINGASIMGDGNIVVSESGTLPIDETPSTTSENALMNKTITNTFATKEAVTEIENEKQDKLTAGDGITISSNSSISIDASQIANAIVLNKFSQYTFYDTYEILLDSLFGDDFIKNYLTSIPLVFDRAVLPNFVFSGKVVNFLRNPMKRITSISRAFGNITADSDYSISFPQLNESGAPVYFNRAFFDIDHKNKVSSISFTSPTYVYDAYQAFYGLQNLNSIDGLDMSKAFGNFSGMFTGCIALKHLGITHWNHSFDISSSTAFEKSDLVEIIGNLDPVTIAQTLTMGATNLAKLTDEEKKVATDKNWVLA